MRPKAGRYRFKCSSYGTGADVALDSDCQPGLNQSKLAALKEIYDDQWGVLDMVSIYANVIDVRCVAPYASDCRCIS